MIDRTQNPRVSDLPFQKGIESYALRVSRTRDAVGHWPVCLCARAPVPSLRLRVCTVSFVGDELTPRGDVRASVSSVSSAI